MVKPVDEHTSPVKKEVHCPVCKSILLTRVPRGRAVKSLLFWLPLKRYMCYKCNRKRYVMD